MSQGNLDDFGGYKKARLLFEFVIENITPLANVSHLSRLVSQQVASAEPVCANIEEGYGRGSKNEFTEFLISACETSGRYERLARWLTPGIAGTRIALCDEILGILTATIKTLRSR